MKTFLDDVPAIDWTDIERAHQTTTTILRTLAADRLTLRRLALGVEKDPRRFEKCEIHSLDDKIVLYDALEERGFRIRFRLATTYQDERPHTHRFSFSTLILRGMYHQAWYRADAELDDSLDVAKLVQVCARDELSGSAFTIHHSAIHSTMTPPDTISLVIRGPAEKTRALIAHKDSGRVWWRYGEADEPPERREEVRMPLDRYRAWCRTLEASDVL